MINEILTKCGVDEAKANEIVKAMEEAKIYTTNLENIDVRYNKLKDKVSQLEETNKNYEVQVKQLSKNNKDNEELTKQLEQLQLSNKELQEKHSKELYERDFNYALDKELASAKCKNNKALRALLDMDSIKYQEGKLEGLEGQLNALKEEANYLFDVEVPQSNGGFNPSGGNPTITKEQFDNMGYFERLNFKQSEPALYEQYANN